MSTATPARVEHRSVDINGLRIFYRAAGDAAHPAIVLLHGFPSSSHMYRDLIPLLADRFRVIAPDYVGFGHSSRQRWISSTTPSTGSPPTCRLCWTASK